MRPVSSQSGFISLRLIILILPIALLWGGGQGLYTALKNRQPTSLTFAEYAEKRPDAKWLKLQETRLEVASAIYFTSIGGDVKDVYIPLRAMNEGRKYTDKTVALLHTREAGIVELVKELEKVNGNSVAFTEFIAKNRDRLAPVREVNGLLEFGIEGSSKQRRKIEKLSDDLAADFVVIEENKKPELGLSLALFLGGFVAMYFCWFRGSGSSTAPRVPVNRPPDLPSGLPPGTIVK